jgi:hypothetical protein
MIRNVEAEISSLREDFNNLKSATKTMLIWIGQSANSPLSRIEINQLLKLIEGEHK